MTVSPVNYHSWRRFWARMFDYFLIGFLFLLLSRNSIFALNNIFLYSALQLIVVISAEAFMLARTGTTAGKSFLGLRVVSPSAPLDFNLAWKRTFWAYVKGLWLGIPIMMFVPAWFARQVLRDSGSTIWDQACGTHIEAEPVGRLRYILFAIVFFMLFAAIGNYEVFAAFAINYFAVRPPSTGMILPVIKLLNGDSTEQITCAISSGSPTRSSG